MMISIDFKLRIIEYVYILRNLTNIHELDYSTRKG